MDERQGSKGRMKHHGTFLSLLCLLAGCAGGQSVEGAPTPPATVEIAQAQGSAAQPLEPVRSTAPELTAAAPAPTAPGCDKEAPAIDRESGRLGAALASANPNIMGPYFTTGFGFYRVKGAAPGPREEADPTLELVLDGPKTLAPGKPLSLKLSFDNKTQDKLVVVRPLDGSLEHWRFPNYDLYLRDEEDGAIYRWAFTGGRCGNVNSITANDYVELEPGKARSDVADNGWAPYLAEAPLPKAGTYSLWVVYSFCGFEGGGVPLGQDLVRKETHLGAHASNALRITVR